MGSVRDFTDPVKQELMSAMQEIDEQDRGFWIFGGLFDGISDLFISEDIACYQGDIQAYHRAMLDKKNTSAEQLEAIWAKVYEIDGRQARNFQDLAECIDVLRHVLDGLSDALDPANPVGNGIPAMLRDLDTWGKFHRQYQNPEYVADHRMQDEVAELLRQDRFSRQTWDAADVAERERILQEFHDEVRRIMGNDANPDLVLKPIAPRGSVPIGGQYEHGSRQIEINSDLLAVGNSHNLLNTVAHENRHAFQHEVVDNPGRHLVSDETRAIWNDSFSNPIRPEKDPEGYWEMPTEWDARGFAKEYQNEMAPPYDGSWR